MLVLRASDIKENSRIRFTLFEVECEGICIGANSQGGKIIRYTDGSVGIITDDFMEFEPLSRFSIEYQNGARIANIAEHGEPVTEVQWRANA